MSKTVKPIPKPSPDTESFWEHCDRKEFVVQKCYECGERQLYPTDSCLNCWNTDLKEIVSCGKGRVVSYTVLHYPKNKAFEDDVPYLLVLVDLEEDVRVMGNLDANPEELSVGDPVKITWEKRGDRNLYQFKLAESFGVGSNET